MRSLLVFGLLVSAFAFSGCLQNSYRSRHNSVAYRPAATPAATAAATAAAVSRADATEIIYVSKPAPDTRSAEFAAPPAPQIPAETTVSADPCDPCNPCKPRCVPCNPIKRLFCNPCIGGG